MFYTFILLKLPRNIEKSVFDLAFKAMLLWRQLSLLIENKCEQLKQVWHVFQISRIFKCFLRGTNEMNCVGRMMLLLSGLVKNIVCCRTRKLIKHLLKKERRKIWVNACSATLWQSCQIIPQECQEELFLYQWVPHSNQDTCHCSSLWNATLSIALVGIVLS